MMEEEGEAGTELEAGHLGVGRATQAAAAGVPSSCLAHDLGSGKEKLLLSSLASHCQFLLTNPKKGLSINVNCASRCVKGTLE